MDISNLSKEAESMESTGIAAPDISGRLARLPLTRRHYKTWWLASLGFFFEGLDLTIVGGILVVLVKVFGLSNQQVGLIGSTALAGYVVGVAVAGVLGDRFGRKFVMKYTLLIFSAFTLLAAFTWSAWSFGVVRFLTGIGIGGESAIVTPYIAEFVQPKYRGRFMGISDSLFTVGLIIASLITMLLIPSSPDGWRYALVIAGLPALYVLVIRRYLPESPLWLQKNGRLDEAEKVVRQFEEDVPGTIPAPAPASTSANAPTAARASSKTAPKSRSLIDLWAKYPKRTFMIWVIWFFIELVYYAFLTWLPSLLVQHGFSVVRSLEYSFLINIAALIGGVGASFLQDTKLGRKNVIILFFLLAGISSYLFSQASTAASVLLFGGLISLLLNGLFSVLYSFTPEQYPTDLRASGQGFASAFGHIGGVFGPFIVGAVLASFGFSGIFSLFAVFLLIPIAAVIGLKEWRGVMLES
jgi:putative MFS transporter